MKWLLLLLPGGLLVLAIAHLVERQRRRRVSRTWLRDVALEQSRNVFVGVSWRWPINKLVNEEAWLQTAWLRRARSRASSEPQCRGLAEERECA